MTTDAIAQIERIDQRAFELRSELEPLQQALARARGRSGPLAPEVSAEITGLRADLKCATADHWIGVPGATREKVAAIRARLDAAEAAAREREAKLAAETDEAGTAASVIAERMQPFLTELGDLATRRELAERRYLREAGEIAGRQLLKAYQETGERFAVFREISRVLAEFEARVPTGRLSYGTSNVSVIEGLPVIGAGLLEAFKDCQHSTLSIQIRDDMRPLAATIPGNVIVSPSVAAAVREKLLSGIVPKT